MPRPLTRGPRTLLSVAVLALSSATASQAAPLQITVTAGQALQLKGQDYGLGTVDGLTHDLAATLGAKLSGAHAAAGAPSQLRLVLQDASPSRPLHGSEGGGLSLGGAWIDGFVLDAYGQKTPLGFSFYRSSLGGQGGNRSGPWADAHHAFALLAADLAHGRVPKTAAPGDKPPPSEAHYPQ